MGSHIPAMGGGCVKGCPACPPPSKKREAPEWRTATATESLLAEHLHACRFSVGSFDKRFARQVFTDTNNGRITDKQSALLRKLVHRYRRQIPREVVSMAGVRG